MTVKAYLEANKLAQYVLTDRVRIPIRADELKYLDLNEITVVKVETINGVTKIHTDYIADQC